MLRFVGRPRIPGAVLALLAGLALAGCGNDDKTPCADASADGACHGRCTGGRTECGGACVDLTSDPANCGACGAACSDGTVCMGSACVAPADLPAFTSTPITTATEDSLYTYEVTATSPIAGATISISATTLPAWLTLTDHQNGTATLSGTPTNAEVGDHAVVLVVSDGGATTVPQSFTITVVNVNDPPTITSSAPTTGMVASPYSYTITATDPDVGATLSFSAPTLPSWLTLTDNLDGTATLAGTPPPAAAALPNDVSIEVSDGLAVGTQSFQIAVTAQPGSPVFTSSAPTNATEDVLYTYAITAQDPDSSGPISFSASTLPSWLTLTDNQDGTATLVGTPTNADVGSHAVVLEASDGSLVGAQAFTIVVANVNDDPSFTSTPVTSATQDAAYSYEITTSDPDVGDVLAITAVSSLPAWLVLTDHGDGTATLAGTPGSADVGSVDIELRVDDGTTNAIQSFTIFVTDKNDPPSFTSTPVLAATEDAPYAYAITTSDPDAGATLTVTAPTLPAWLSLVPTGNGTATLSGTPTNADVGDHSVVLSVTDGTNAVTQSFTITVANVNDAPTFTSNPVLSATEDSLYTYSVVASDVDVGDALTIGQTTLPSWLSLQQGANGTATLTGTPTNSDVGSHPVTLTVSDGTETVTQSFTIVVANANDAPTAILLSNDTVAENQASGTVVGTLSTTDVDVGDTFTYSLVSGTGSSGNGSFQIVGNSLRTAAVLDFETQSSYSIRVRTTDSASAIFEEVFTISVTNAADAPVATSHAYTIVGNTELVASEGTKTATAQGRIFLASSEDLRTGASDQDSAVASLVASVVTGPSHGTLAVNGDGSFTYVPAAGYTGADSFTYRLGDGVAFSSPATVSITVQGRVWYLNDQTNADSAGARNPVGGDGRSTDPFDTIAAFEGAGVSAAGDVLYVFGGDEPYVTSDADGLTLLASQQLVGEAAALVVGTIPLAPANPAARPSIVSTTGVGVTLGNTCGLTGLAIQSTSGIALASGGATGGALVDVNLGAGAGAVALDLNGHQGTFVYATGVVTGLGIATGIGARIRGATAPTVTFTDVGFSNLALGYAQTAGAADTTFAGTSSLVQATGGAAIAIAGVSTGASLTFSGVAAVNVSGLTAGVDALSIDANNGDFDATFLAVTIDAKPGRDAIVLRNFGTGSVTSFAGSTDVLGATDEGLVIEGSGTATPSFTFADLGITDADTRAVRITGGRPTVDLGLDAASGISVASARAVEIASLTGGSVLFQGGPLSSTGGGLLVTGVATSATTLGFDSTVSVTGSVAPGLEVTGSGNASLRFASLSVNTTSQVGVSVSTAAGFRVDAGSIQTTGAIGLALSAIPTTNVTLSSVTVSNPNGAGVTLATLGGTTRLGTLNVTNSNGVGLAAIGAGTVTSSAGSTIATTTGKALDLDTVTSGLSFARIASSSSPAEGVELDSVSGTMTIDDGNVGTANDLRVLSPTTSALDVAASGLTMNVSSVDFDTATGSGLRITGGNGSLTVSGGTIDASAGPEIDVDQGSMALTCAAAVTNGAAGISVEVTNRTGGALALSGPIVDNVTGIRASSNTGGSLTTSGNVTLSTGANPAIDLATNTGATFTFGTGTLAITTTSGPGLRASGGGTLNVLGTSNTIASGTGRAIDVQNVSFGASGATFRSVSSNGSTNGILLSNTGSAGGLSVTGNGSAGTGGTIQNTTGDAISLANTSSPSFAFMNLSNGQANGIAGGPVAGLTVSSCSISGYGNAVGEGGIRLVNGVSGTVAISSTTVTGSAEHNVSLVVLTGTTATVNVTGSTFSTPGATFGADGFDLEARGSATATLDVSGSSFNGNRSDHLEVFALDSSNVSVNVSSSTFVNTAQRGIALSSASSAVLSFDVNGNTMTGNNDATSMGVRLATLSTTTGTARVQGRVRNQSTFASYGFGISADQRGLGRILLEANNNTMTNVGTSGIDFIAGAAMSDNARSDLTLNNNSITMKNTGTFEPIALVTTQSTFLCADIRGNSLNNPGGGEIYLDRISPTSTFQVPTSPNGCSGAGCTAIATYLPMANTLAAPGSVTVLGTPTAVAPGSCQLPP